MRKKKPPDSDRQQLRQQTPPRLASPSPPPSPSWGPGGLQRDEATGSCAQWQVPPACSGPAPARCWWCWLAVNGPIRAHLGPLRSAARPPLCPRAHQTARLASFGATSLTGALSKKKKNHVLGRASPEPSAASKADSTAARGRPTLFFFVVFLRRELLELLLVERAEVRATQPRV